MHADSQMYLGMSRSATGVAGRQSHGGSHLLVKGVLTAGVFLFICMLAPMLGPFFTFLLLDILLSVYLFSLFRGHWRLLFLVHPLFVYISGFGFQIPFTEIGTGYAYLQSYRNLVDPVALVVDWEGVIFTTFLSQKGSYGFAGGAYIGTYPILLFPEFLFGKVPDITFYHSLSLWALICTAIAVNAAMIYRVIRKKVLLILALYVAVSPTFFDINGVLHRYHLLVLGLFLFLIAYLGLTRKRIGRQHLPLIGLLLVSIVLVGVSKAPLFLSLALFIILDFWARGKLLTISSILKALHPTPRLMVILTVIAVAQFMAPLFVPEIYVEVFSQLGGQYQTLSNVPIIGLVLRVLYAALGAFPWTNFDQWQLFGNNTIFLAVHMLSALLVVWIILSFCAKWRRILQGPDDIRTCVMFGISIMGSLAFSSIGWHVYLAPAMPFLAALLHERANRITFLYPVMFVVVMEIVAQAARLLR